MENVRKTGQAKEIPQWWTIHPPKNKEKYDILIEKVWYFTFTQELFMEGSFYRKKDGEGGGVWGGGGRGRNREKVDLIIESLYPQKHFE